MALFLNTNVASLGAQRNLWNNTSSLNKSLERLSSGLRINRAGDGAGTLLASENMRSQIRGLQAANRNVQQGISMLNTADGALQSIYDDLQRMREVAVEASNGTITDWTPFTNEVNGLITAIDQTATGTTFNGNVLLDGSVAAMEIQYGADNGQSLDIAAAFADAQAATLGVNPLDVSSQANAQAAIATVDGALATLAGIIADVGGFQNSLENQMNSNMVAIENYSSAEASLRNTDVAAESANLVKAQILQQASALALAQANQAPAIALTLLQGL